MVTKEQKERTVKHLTWMIESLDYQKKLSGLETPDSPEMADAKNLLKELTNGESKDNR